MELFLIRTAILRTNGLAVGTPKSAVLAETFVKTWNRNIANINKTSNNRVLLICG
jgi:hypothetical protein